MRTITDQIFGPTTDIRLPPLLNDVTITRCTMNACCFGTTAHKPSERRKVRNVTLIDCVANNCSVGPIIVEDVTIQGLKCTDFRALGAVYRHVRIRGRCGYLMLNAPWKEDSYKLKPDFARADAEFYKTVDWSLDISEAEFSSPIDIRYGPSSLVRRDLETQVIVRRDKVEAAQDFWRSSADLAGTFWPIMLDNMLLFGMQDRVLAAPKRRKDFAKQLEGLRLLRREGIADPD